MSILSLLLPTLAASFSFYDCPHYSCNLTATSIPDIPCSEFLSETNEFIVHPGVCSPDQFCWSFFTGNGSCQSFTGSKAVFTPLPGEVCDESHHCIDDVQCVRGRCAALSTGAKCRNGWDCGTGDACVDGVCVRLGAPGSSCKSNWECQLNAMCDVDLAKRKPGTCVEMLSLPPNHPVHSCNGPANALLESFLCASTLCYVPIGSETGYCADWVSSSQPLPYKCDHRFEECESTREPKSSLNVTQICSCSYGGEAYCPLFPGDPPYRRFLDSYRKYLQSPALLTCNKYRLTFSPYLFFGNWCAETTARPSEELLYYYYQTTQYVEEIGAEECVLEVMLPSRLRFSRQAGGDEANAQGWGLQTIGGIAILIAS